MNLKIQDFEHDISFIINIAYKSIIILEVVIVYCKKLHFDEETFPCFVCFKPLYRRYYFKTINHQAWLIHFMINIKCKLISKLVDDKNRYLIITVRRY